MAAEARFTFDGRPVAAAPGQSLAASLTAAGIRAFRTTATGAGRGVFCGMGVCQDCLVTVDGVPGRRACMTPAAAGMVVTGQPAFPALEPAAAAPAPPPGQRIAPDVLVVGGGAAGLAAAAEAARAGASVVLLDERGQPGGQFYKQAAGGLPALDAQQSAGARLIAEARAAGAALIGGAEVWGAFDGPLLIAEAGGAALVAAPKTLVVATGAYERPALVPGWTLPGVMTTGAGQTLWRSHRSLPGRRLVVAGSGPLNLQVALELARGGAEIVLVAEAGPHPAARPAAVAALLAAGPRLALQGAAMMAALARRGVPLRHRSRLVAIEPAGGALRAVIDGPGGRRAAVADAVLMNEGFEPQNEILRLLGAAMDHDPAVGHLRCRRDARMETTVANLYAAGDCAGLGGAPAAEAEGRIAGRAAAAAAGHGDASDPFAFRRARSRARRFQRALWALHDIAPRPVAGLDDGAILCRCEEVTVGAARAALAAMQPAHAGSLKRLTRVGMGRCQGRYCGPVAARLVAEATGRPLDAMSLFAPRVPVKPVTVAAVLAAEQAMAAGDAGG